jgi:tetratricopeptide (TPR) repeat protein
LAGGVCYTDEVASIFGKLLKRGAIPASRAGQFAAICQDAAEADTAGDYERALSLYERALTLDPSHAEAYYKRGNCLKNLGRLEAAIASFNQAIGHRAHYPYAYCNRGVVQQALGLTTEALMSYDRSIALDPAEAMAHYNRALLLQECSRREEALESYDRAIAINPEYADAQFNRSLAALFRGEFERGWRGYEWRWKNASRLGIGELRQFTQPLWLGVEPVAGKRVLLHSEAGLGDTIQFCRYAPALAAMGATVYLEVQPHLLGLLSSLAGVSQLMASGSALPPFDYHCPLMSLPLAFKTTLETIPSARSYLRSTAQDVAQWRARLPQHGRPRVGLAWSGNSKNLIDGRRSIRLADWIAHLPEEFDFFCLQKDVREEDQRTLDSNPRIVGFDDEPDFINTAALCECMDIVISVDTSVAHLSAALGRPTWILLPFIPDWRWMAERDDSPWYPSAKLYRQTTVGDWDEVLARVAGDLRRELSGG